MDRWNRTHEALSRAAMELFTERGYEATGTAQIAARAGVSEMTLFRHFSSKEALLLDDPFDPLMAEAVRMRPEEEPPILAAVEGIRQTLTQVDAESFGPLRDRLRIVACTPALGGAIERNSADSVAAITAALEDRGVPHGRARVAASAVIAGLGAALLDWAATGRTSLAAVLDEALEVLGGG